MSGILSREAAALEPYTPGEQPRDKKYIKLNTNESPFPPSPKVLEAITARELKDLNLYSDPTLLELTAAIAKRNGLKREQVTASNGSDEVLAFAFRAWCGKGRKIAFADVTYGCYATWARLFRLESEIIPLREDFTLAVDDYERCLGTVVVANPNAPTGMALPLSELRRLCSQPREGAVIIDEAYVDFGAESCAELIEEFDNLLVVQTFSKSRSLAGARIGFAMGNEALIADLERVRYSLNPYNVNRLSIKAGAAAMADEGYFISCTQRIIETREAAAKELEGLGFEVLPSSANFLFVRNDKKSGEELYKKLKEKGVLVRHFKAPRVADWCRITVGTPEQMSALADAIKAIL